MTGLEAAVAVGTGLALYTLGARPVPTLMVGVGAMLAGGYRSEGVLRAIAYGGTAHLAIYGLSRVLPGGAR